MPEYDISGVSVNFPFEPYDVQRRYMEKVIECLDKGTNGVLESPTGTGKTLSLLCSALGWVSKRKQEAQANIEEQLQKMEKFNKENGIDTKSLPHRRQLVDSLIDSLNTVGNSGGAMNAKAMMGVPRVIYASRTHSQISQAMQELKRTSYSHMKAAVIGSRDQLCIHPDLAKESNANKIQMCKLKVTTRTCHFHNRLESQKESPEFRQATVLDIEDIVRIGKKLRCCPYYASKELMDDAEIIFMPYNYLLDPKMRKANKLDLYNTIIILDEAHNVEKMCEESASVQITSSDVAVAIEDVSHILTPMVENGGSLPLSFDAGGGAEEAKDFTVDDLVLLKEILLNLETAIDNIPMQSSLAGHGETFEGVYMFDLLAKVNITQANVQVITELLDTLIQYLTSIAEANSSAFRRGAGLQRIHELLMIVFSSSAEDFRQRVSKCYKVYVENEQPKQPRGKVNEGWIQPKSSNKPKTTAKIVNYWCFSPGFGMQHLLGKNVRSIILTSGTLAPLKPLISELDIPISVNLENPHIVNGSQVCVKIVSHGSDREALNSNYENRSNPKYISSLGRTILAFCPVVPHGLLVFFPSYYILNTCKEKWQESGIWSQIQRTKPIFVEPQTKEAFLNTMEEYYNKIHEPNSRGAIFMAVCRGKVSEGLDFADENGRAVIITGLPFPPFKDPKVVLKKKYLCDNRTRENELLSGDDWYFLEASRAVNQAIGRVIRHKNDYGAILLCDTRFNNPRQKNQLSGWIQKHLRNQNASQPFGSMIGEIARFFKNAERTLPQPSGLKPIVSDLSDDSPIKLASETLTKPKLPNSSVKKRNENDFTNLQKANDVFSWDMYKNPSGSTASKEKPADLFSRLNDSVNSIDFNNVNKDYDSSLVTIHKRNRPSQEGVSSNSTVSPSILTDLSSFSMPRRKKYRMIPNETTLSSTSTSTDDSFSVNAPTEAVNNTNTELPSDRKELLKFIKKTLNPQKYQIFLNTFLQYNNDSNYDAFLANLLDVFDEKQWHYILRGMIRFAKSTHKTAFERDVNNHILGQ